VPKRVQAGGFLGVTLFLLTVAPAYGQFKEGPSEGIKLGESATQRWRNGLSITAAGGACQRVVGTLPIPVDWPEQQVKVVNEEVSPLAKMSEQVIDGVRQMVVSVPNLPAGQEARAVVTYEITRHAILAPKDPETYQKADPKRMDRTVRPYLGSSPQIESRSPKIAAVAKQLAAEKRSDWAHVEAIYDWVRNNVEYKSSIRKVRGALVAIQERQGGHEDLCSLFIAVCRASDIPARTVWVPGFCYPEFYLVDKEGKGHWFPCQVAGSRAFGEIPEHRPILEKGDNFRNPQNPRERVRYLPETLSATGSSEPKYKFIREAVD